MTPIATGTGPPSNEPLRCGLNSSPSNTDAMCNLPQFAKFLRGGARCCLATALFGHLTSYPGNWVPPPSCGCATVGWVGALNFFQVCHFLELYRRDAASRSLRCSRPILEPHSMVAPRGAGGFPLAQAQRRRSLMDAVGQHAGAG